MMLAVGIDIGSTYTKAVMMDGTRSVRATAISRSGYKPAAAAAAVYEDLLANAGVTPVEVSYIATSGYGRYMVPFRHTQITELTCHALATVYHFPQVRTILDIGGQDIKAIRIDERGWHGRVPGEDRPLPRPHDGRYRAIRPALHETRRDQQRVRGIRRIRGHQPSLQWHRARGHCARRDCCARRTRCATHEARRPGEGFRAGRRDDAECGDGGSDCGETWCAIEPASAGVGPVQRSLRGGFARVAAC
jgi:hypothetical protein